MWSMRILVAVILLGASVAGQGPFSIKGVVTDVEGNSLPGAEITVEGRAAPVILADSRGAFEISNLPAGAYAVRATLPGFRPQTLSVPLQRRLRAPIKFVLTIAVLIEAPIPLPAPREALRRADAIALVRLEGLAPAVPCADLVVVSAVHDATVLEVWKGKVPAGIQILETGKGACLEGGRRVEALSGISTSYRVGAEYVVLLAGKGTRFGGLGLGSFVFAVDGQTVSTDGFMGLADTMALREFQLKIHQVAR